MVLAQAKLEIFLPQVDETVEQRFTAGNLNYFEISKSYTLTVCGDNEESVEVEFFEDGQIESIQSVRMGVYFVCSLVDVDPQLQHIFNDLVSQVLSKRDLLHEAYIRGIANAQR